MLTTVYPSVSDANIFVAFAFCLVELTFITFEATLTLKESDERFVIFDDCSWC